MSGSSPQTPAKPGTACLGCRRRKLKCSRETAGCKNCLKSALPCVYPVPGTAGIKRKRGPYRKDTRERHLEDVVKYLEPGAWQSKNDAGNTDDEQAPASASVPAHGATSGICARGPHLNRKPESSTNPEELVKDALVALTGSSVTMEEINDEESGNMAKTTNSELKEPPKLGLHPSINHIFECWHLFTFRVDPLTKVIHCPTFTKKIVAVIDNLKEVGTPTEALLFSIYFAAVSTCTALEAYRRFGESREVLLHRFGRSVEASLADNYSLPVMESLQALVIYMIAIRREDNTTNLRALFSLGVRMSQLMGLQEDQQSNHSPFETQLRRRLWWHLCGLESRGSEEGFARSNSIVDECDVELPANLFDFDLHPDMEETPKPRTGCTDMTFLLLRCETVRMSHRIWKIRKIHASRASAENVDDLKRKQTTVLEEFKVRFQTHYFRHLDESRPYDYLCLGFIKAILIKVRLNIDHPFGQVPTKQMASRDRFDLLQASVDIIRLTYAASGRKAAEPWLWYFRSWNQWHSLAIVVAELGGSTNRQFIEHTWKILDPILARWDRVYGTKRDEPAWDHVNSLIERARQMRRKNMQSSHELGNERIAPEMHDATSSRFNKPLGMSNVNELMLTEKPLKDIDMNDPYTTQLQQWTSGFGQGSAMPAFGTGCAPAVFDFEADYGYFDGLDSIDFSAFDAVFGDGTWDFSSPNTEWSTETLNL